jgi:hypothetical protein
LSDITNPGNGSPVYGGDSASLAFGVASFGSATFADMTMLPDPGAYPSGTEDLSSGNYTLCDFFVSATQSEPAAFIAGVGGTPAPSPVTITVTTAWQGVTLNLPTNLTAVTEPLGVNLSPTNNTVPVTFYLDNIQYQ